MIIMRGGFEVTEESQIEKIFSIKVKDDCDNAVTLDVCCTKVNHDWCYCDGPDKIANAWLLYSVGKRNDKIYINGIYCTADCPLGGYWIDKGSIRVLEEMICKYYGCNSENAVFDRKNPYLPVSIYTQLAYYKGEADKVVGKYTLRTVRNVHTIYLEGKPLVSISDAVEGIYLNRWVLVDIPNGFPHKDKDITKRKDRESLLYYS